MILPLNVVENGSTVEIKMVARKEEILKRISELGLIVGSKFKVVKNDNHKMIIMINRSRLAIDSNIANKIMVEA